MFMYADVCCVGTCFLGSIPSGKPTVLANKRQKEDSNDGGWFIGVQKMLKSIGNMKNK